MPLVRPAREEVADLLSRHVHQPVKWRQSMERVVADTRGNLALVEAMGQLALCLLHFLAAGRVEIAPEARPRSVRATRVHHAVFLEPVIPGEPAILNGFFMIASARDHPRISIYHRYEPR